MFRYGWYVTFLNKHVSSRERKTACCYQTIAKYLWLLCVSPPQKDKQINSSRWDECVHIGTAKSIVLCTLFKILKLMKKNNNKTDKKSKFINNKNMTQCSVYLWNWLSMCVCVFVSTYLMHRRQLPDAGSPCDCWWPSQWQTTCMWYCDYDKCLPLFASVNGTYGVRPHWNVRCVRRTIPPFAICNCVREWEHTGYHQSPVELWAAWKTIRWRKRRKLQRKREVKLVEIDMDVGGARSFSLASLEHDTTWN